MSAKSSHKLNGLLCIDALSGEEFFQLSPGSKTEDVSEYLASVVFGLRGVRLHQTLHHPRQQPNPQAKDAISVGCTSGANGISQGNYS